MMISRSLISIIFTTLIFLLVARSSSHSHNDKATETSESKLKNLIQANECLKVPGFSEELRNEIRSKSEHFDELMNLVLNGSEKHSTYNELAYFVDTFGPRLSGSKSLTNAISYMTEKMEKSKLTIRNEKAMVPGWSVGNQWAEMIRPVKRPMSILALGSSVSTGNKTLTAEAVVVNSFPHLDRLAQEGKIEGKIVVYNYNFTDYSESVKFRTDGARRASKYGAVAALVRSVTPFSIYSPHAGSGSKSIPTAALTVEDADMIERWTARRRRVVLRLFIDSQDRGEQESANVIGDITGTSKPEEIVLVSGHIDSWYNTEGAMDDGGGMMISYKALDLLRKLKLRARRTIRAVLWTAEEPGLYGAKQYMKNHQHELKNFKAVFESDLGTFKPLGLSVTNASPLMQCTLAEILKLTKSIGTDKLNSDFEGSDIEVFTDQGTLGLSLLNENSKYFYFHHTAGDSMTVEDPDHLDKATILWATASYVLADLSIDY